MKNLSKETKEQIQADYVKLNRCNFAEELKKLAEKYGLTYDELLDTIEL